MGRAWRIEFEGALYHVLSRGNERREIFYNAGDRRLFLRRLGEMAERYEIEVYAYVLMANHYHILMRTHRANLSKAMHWFGVSYTNRFNAMHGRSGHLFQGRFKSMLVENDAYLLGVSHYIHRNPLRAGIVKRLVDYPWSSYRAYAYGKPGAKITTGGTVGATGPVPANGGTGGAVGSMAGGTTAGMAGGVTGGASGGVTGGMAGICCGI